MYQGGGGDARCFVVEVRFGGEVCVGGGGASDGGDESYIAEEAEVAFLQT